MVIDNLSHMETIVRENGIQGQGSSYHDYHDVYGYYLKKYMPKYYKPVEKPEAKPYKEGGVAIAIASAKAVVVGGGIAVANAEATAIA